MVRQAYYCVAGFLVAGPGIAPGLEDYACADSHCCESRTVSSSQREAWRAVSTDSLVAQVASVLTRQGGLSTDIAKFAACHC